MFDRNGRVALVSGAARGIGTAIAQTMVDHGAKVVIGDVLDGEGQALAEKIGPPATYVHLDVTSPDEWTAAVATAVDRYGKLDVLVNNAGRIMAEAAGADVRSRRAGDVRAPGARRLHPGRRGR
jgi:NAD(P)-dependent dehydrogenase (short-subunit alcohol dehydrogenase family)